MKFFFIIYSFLFGFLCLNAQDYQWQWAKTGGGNDGAYSSTFNELQDEMIRDIAIDSDNNAYYLTSLYGNDPQLEGAPLTHYGRDSSKDFLLFSTDCEGNIRWTRTLGGSNDLMYAWQLEIDNNGGVPNGYPL